MKRPQHDSVVLDGRHIFIYCDCIQHTYLNWREIDEWLVERKIHWDFRFIGNDTAYQFSFDSKTEAMLFKLKFG